MNRKLKAPIEQEVEQVPKSKQIIHVNQGKEQKEKTLQPQVQEAEQQPKRKVKIQADHEIQQSYNKNVIVPVDNEVEQSEQQDISQIQPSNDTEKYDGKNLKKNLQNKDEKQLNENENDTQNDCCRCLYSLIDYDQGIVKPFPYVTSSCETYLRFMIFHDFLFAIFYTVFGIFFIQNSGGLGFGNLNNQYAGYTFLGFAIYLLFTMTFAAFMYFPGALRFIRYAVSIVYILFASILLAMIVIIGTRNKNLINDINKYSLGINDNLQQTVQNQFAIYIIISLIIFFYSFWQFIASFLLIQSLEILIKEHVEKYKPKKKSQEPTENGSQQQLKQQQEIEIEEDLKKQLEEDEKQREQLQIQSTREQENKQERKIEFQHTGKVVPLFLKLIKNDVQEDSVKWENQVIIDEKTGQNFEIVLPMMEDDD